MYVPKGMRIAFNPIDSMLLYDTDFMAQITPRLNFNTGLVGKFHSWYWKLWYFWHMH